MSHEYYMKLAIDEAVKGIGWTNPNPIVGAVIVKNDNVISRGYHKKYGELHAERNALANCKESCKGATMYVTLEPCCHYGKTPPCTEAIIKSGITTIVIGSQDTNPLVAGGGIKVLRENGINVVAGVLMNECDELNEVFFHYIKAKTPYVVMKYAMTADGKIATHTGASRWITGEKSRKDTHKLRHRYSGIMVGVGTVLADNPMLNCRLENASNPVRIVCDTNLRTPINSNIVKTANIIPTYIATCCVDKLKQEEYFRCGCEIISLPKQGEHIDLKVLMEKLGERKIDSILLEGGSTLNYSALKSGIVNKIISYISPKIIGGKTAKTPVGGEGVDYPDDAFMLGKPKIKPIDNDVFIEWEVKNNVYRHS